MTSNIQTNAEDERVALELFKELVSTFAKDFPIALLEAREELVVNGVLNNEKFLLALAEVSDAQARAAYIMSTHAAVARNPDAKALFEHWAMKLQAQRDIVLAPGFSTEQKINALNDSYRAGWGQQFQAFGRTTSLGELAPRVSTGIDLIELGAALVSGDEKKLAGASGSILGGMLGLFLARPLVVVFGFVGFKAAVIIATAQVVSSYAGRALFEGPLFDLVSSDPDLLPSTPGQLELGRLSSDDVIFIHSGNRGFVFAGEGNDRVYGSDGTVIFYSRRIVETQSIVREALNKCSHVGDNVTPLPG